ncbi:MAG: hypothetical protein DRP83_00045 [Planctomycetota bacterium]|nr:MAG: hypothetical protein DRP83_00045 [Planctomycetota bacterium]
MGDPMDSRPPKTPRSTFSSSPNGGVSLKWIERELSRLDSGKVDKAHYKPELSNLKEKLSTFEKQISEVKREIEDDLQKLQTLLGDDVSDAQAAAISAESKAGQQEERVELVEKTVNFWGTWFLRGLVGMILLLITAGGGWVYSHVRLEETAKNSSKAVENLRVEVVQVKRAQQEQRDTLTRMESRTFDEEEEVEKALRRVLIDVLDKKKE